MGKLCTIRGIPVEFPFEPYKLQIDYMAKIVEALQSRTNALLESPTGTGKTASLLCATLAWREAYALALAAKNAGNVDEESVSEAVRAAGLLGPRRMPSTETKKEGTSGVNIPGLGTYTYADAKPGEKVALDVAPNQDVFRPSRIIYASRTHSQLSQVVRELRSTRYRPRTILLASRAQLCVNPHVRDLPASRQNRACAGLCSSRQCGFRLSLDEFVGKLPFGMSPSEIHVSEKVGDFKLVLASGAHRRSNLTLSYDAEPVEGKGSSGMGQRAGLSSSKVKERRGFSGIMSGIGGGGEETRRNVSSVPAVVSGGGGMEELGSGPPGGDTTFEVRRKGILDVEELASLGSSKGYCPYYLPRAPLSLMDSQLVLMPYNYLLDASVRQILTRDAGPEFWSDAVVVIDEAHNVEQAAADSASVDIPPAMLSRAVDEVTVVLAELITKDPPVHPRLGFRSEDGTPAWGSLDEVPVSSRMPHKIAIDVKRMLLEMEKKLSTMKLPQHPGLVRPGQDIYDFLNTWQVNPETWRGPNGLRSILGGIVDFLQWRIGAPGRVGSDEVGEEAAPLPAALRGGGDLAMDGLLRALDVILGEEGPGLADLYRFVIHDVEQDEGRSKDFSVGEETRRRTLSWWCMVPGVALRQLSAMGVRSIVLTSGTLSPLESYASELVLPFPVRLENPHVVPRAHILAACLAAGPRRQKLNSSYANRSSPAYKTELGALLAGVCRLVPGGVLAFFPSYRMMEEAVEFWKTEGGGRLWTALEGAKVPVMEPRKKDEVVRAVATFRNAIVQGHGSLLLAVCRGKFSEGVDFRDAECRAVVVTGLPFPPLRDAYVMVKRAFLDEMKSAALSGEAWYRQQASRAVNQALGRAIRHRLDWGVILLADERFTQSAARQSLPAWLRPWINSSAKFSELVPRIRDFCATRERGAAPPSPIADGATDVSVSEQSTPMWSMASFPQPLAQSSVSRFERSTLSKSALPQKRPRDDEPSPLQRATTQPKKRPTLETLSKPQTSGSTRKEDFAAKLQPHGRPGHTLLASQHSLNAPLAAPPNAAAAEPGSLSAMLLEEAQQSSFPTSPPTKPHHPSTSSAPKPKSSAPPTTKEERAAKLMLTLRNVLPSERYHAFGAELRGMRTSRLSAMGVGPLRQALFRLAYILGVIARGALPMGAAAATETRPALAELGGEDVQVPWSERVELVRQLVDFFPASSKTAAEDIIQDIVGRASAARDASRSHRQPPIRLSKQAPQNERTALSSSAFGLGAAPPDEDAFALPDTTTSSSRIEPCPICQSTEGPWQKSKKCGHIICRPCWTQWLTRRIECPLCRAKCRSKYLEDVLPPLKKP